MQNTLSNCTFLILYFCVSIFGERLKRNVETVLIRMKFSSQPKNSENEKMAKKLGQKSKS